MPYDYGQLASPVESDKPKGKYDYGQLASPVESPKSEDRGSDDTKPVRTFGGELLHQAGMIGRDIVEGVTAPGRMLLDASTGLTNLGRRAFGGTPRPMPSEKWNPAMDETFGKPEGPLERVVNTAAADVAGAATTVGAGQVAKEAGPIAKGIASQFAARPVAQGASAALSGGAGQTAAEMGAGPGTQTAVSLATGTLPFMVPGSRVPSPPGSPQSEKARIFKDAREHGYVVTPTAVAPTGMSDTMESMTNKMKLTSKTSIDNAAARAGDIRQEFGMEKGPEITTDELDQIRDRAYGDFKALVDKLKAAKPHITAKGEVIPEGSVRPNPEFEAKIKKIADESVGLKTKYPTLVEGPTRKRMDAMVKSLVQPHDAEDTVELIKSLRRQASSNLSAMPGKRPSPFNEAVGQFQYKAAGALEDLMEANLKSPELVDAMKQARKTIAQTYAVQYALNPSGEVSGLKLARYGRTAPLTGALKRAADYATAFPQDNREVARVGGHPPLSAWDFLVAGGTAVAGHPGMAAAEIGARAGIPSILTSDWYQNRINPDVARKPTSPGGYPSSLIDQIMGTQNQLPPPP